MQSPGNSRIQIALVAPPFFSLPPLPASVFALPGLQEAAARRFDEGLENALTEAQVAEVLEKNVGKTSAKLS